MWGQPGLQETLASNGEDRAWKIAVKILAAFTEEWSPDQVAINSLYPQDIWPPQALSYTLSYRHICTHKNTNTRPPGLIDLSLTWRSGLYSNPALVVETAWIKRKKSHPSRLGLCQWVVGWTLEKETEKNPGDSRLAKRLEEIIFNIHTGPWLQFLTL